ncbi:MAG: hypothetical protein U0800_27320 [Isosphaeraceae bacterium]
MKLSTGKKTYPMAKQVFRQFGPDGRFLRDFVAEADEAADGEPLLRPVIRNGKLVGPLPDLEAIRFHCREQLARLPEPLLGLDAIANYPMAYSDRLEAAAIALGVKS